MAAAGLNFQAQAGKTYQITVRFNSNTAVEVTSAGFMILTGGNLTGEISGDMVSQGNSGWIEGTELTASFRRAPAGMSLEQN